MKIIYLDHHATTPVDPRVLEAMLPYFTEHFGNAASRSHSYGSVAEEAVEKARTQVADLLSATARDVIFTSGATESINLALRGISNFYRERGNHIITCQTEHRAVLYTCQALENNGFRVTYLPVDEWGRITLDHLEAAVSKETILISIMFGNHEIGTLQDVEAIGRIAKSSGVFFHCDATQAVGCEAIDVERLGVDILSLSAHKIYGPKGTGALYVRRKNPRVRLSPILSGGGQERGHRSGTLNVPGIVGLGQACEILKTSRKTEHGQISKLRDRLKEILEQHLDGLQFNGHPEKRLAGNLSVSFADVEGHSLLPKLADTIAVSAGASCTSAIPEPSYILKAIGGAGAMAQATIRIGIGRFNSKKEIEIAGQRIVAAVRELRTAKSPQSVDCSDPASDVRH